MRVISLITIICLATLIAGAVATILPAPLNGPGTATGYYEVRSDVEGAEVYFDDTQVGTISQGVLVLPVYIDGTPYQSYTVKKAGYSKWTEQIFQIPKKNQTIVFHAMIQANPVVSVGEIDIAANPPGPEVYLDGTLIGTIPPSGARNFLGIPSGNHQLILKLTGYQDYSEKIFVPAGGIAPVRVTFVPVTPVAGSVSFSTSPIGATVSVDGQNRGIAPLVLSALSPGTHTAVFSLPGYQDYTIAFTVTAGQQSVVTAGLNPVPVTGASTAPRAGGSWALIFIGAFALCGYIAARRG
jgi:hypothetical protein